jgi:two-component system, cell cycle response regulator DivK
MNSFRQSTSSGNLTDQTDSRPVLNMPPTILIAEDYDDNRELLRLLLAGANYDVREARNGQECLDLARANPPDLIMVDLSMPGLDGWEVFKELKANSSTAHIPCVAVTAHTDRDRIRALQSGFSDFVGKPFRTEELLRTVARLVPKESVEQSA